MYLMILEDLKVVSDTIKNIVEFIQVNEKVKPDFDEYIKTIGVGDNTDFNSACLNYIFERRLLDNQPIAKIYLDNKKLSNDEKLAVKSILNSIHSVFEIKKVEKNGFLLYSVINEKTYDTVSLVKMSAFRGLGAGQYIVARIAKYEDSTCLLEVTGVLPSYKKEDALRYSVAKLVESPELAYQDNPEKQKQLEADIECFYSKFMELFGSDEILTVNNCADELIGAFNEFAELGKKSEISEMIKFPQKYKYFNVEAFQNSYNDFLENSLGGFASHSEEYDVGIIYDRELGLYAVPFWGTFNKIYEIDDYKTIEGYKECVRNFLENAKISANLIKRCADKHKNFVSRTNEIMQTGFTLEGFLKQYKPQYLENKIFSPTSDLYQSSAFSNTLGIIEEDINIPISENSDKQIDYTGVGRNDLCPCGSGKKFKKCCGRNL